MHKRTESEIRSNWKSHNEIKVSVCCITYNQERYIEKAIDSFLGQYTSFPFEIIIGDDHSTDNTYKILEQYKKEYPNIVKVIRSEENIGANANILQVFNASKGKYIALCEGDDYWISENKLEIQFNEMKSNSSCKFSFHRAFLENDIGNKTIAFNKGNKNKYYDINDIINSYYQFSPTSSYMFERDFILKKIPSWFNQAAIGDFFLELYGSSTHKPLYIANTLSVYRVESHNSWTERIKKNYSKYLKTQNNIIKFTLLCSNELKLKNRLIDKRISFVYYNLAIRSLYNKKYFFYSYYLRKSIKLNTTLKNSMLWLFLKSPKFTLKTMLLLKLIKNKMVKNNAKW
ncbi:MULTISPECIES: glycosyltransferase [Providencia]|uniref:glycosyltransferase n=1 Tax=Providencia TaxID=586 RepID=UPI000D997714|nr:glycosyltransferase [Providencia rettgeri]MCG5281876.1 glycosyltransferase [Providencia rettgeri]PYZ60600.1 hypothetical protein DNK63_16425 [Providencia rettgeri]